MPNVVRTVLPVKSYYYYHWHHFRGSRRWVWYENPKAPQRLDSVTTTLATKIDHVHNPLRLHSIIPSSCLPFYLLRNLLTRDIPVRSSLFVFVARIEEKAVSDDPLFSCLVFQVDSNDVQFLFFPIASRQCIRSDLLLNAFSLTRNTNTVECRDAFML